MHWRMPCRRQSQVSTQSYAREKARGQASRQQACGEREGQSLSHRGSSPNATQRISWANKVPTERGKIHRQKQAGNSPRKERTHFPRTPLPVCGRELPAFSSATALLALNSEAPSAVVHADTVAWQSPAIECQYSRHNNTRAGGRGTPP